MRPKHHRYLSYLLRLWNEEKQEADSWRASLEIPGSGKQIAFKDLASMFAFIKEATSQTNEVELRKELDGNGQQKDH